MMWHQLLSSWGESTLFSLTKVYCRGPVVAGNPWTQQLGAWDDPKHRLLSEPREYRMPLA
jgi:hypothetical protein